LKTGQVVNYDSFARNIEVLASTIKEWLSVLEDSFLIALDRPYFSNKNKN